ncbi:prepilin peptidase [Fertoebacter nigrum]|uniref:Prepilin peptidase n=1 Tax=Fertoeibacter niger TaxID=2656921 RepID=A0A8X8KLX0_9RHOB|nr:prepilin peptidase [Fertoeibacter niger]
MRRVVTGETLFLLAVSVGLGLVLVAITLIDLRQFRIPDALSLPLLAAGLALAAVTQAWWPDHLIGAALGYGMLAGIGEVYFRRRGVEGLGLGDAKLFAAAGAWLGWQALPAVLLIAALGGIAQALVLHGGQRDRPLAFGPWLALGFAALWLWRLVRGEIWLNLW